MNENDKKVVVAVIPKGFGFWDTTHFPIGGAFRRAGFGGVRLVSFTPLAAPVKGCDHEGVTTTGKRVAFRLSNISVIS